MILPDVSVLIHAHNVASPLHDVAREWWDERLAGPRGVGLAWVVILGFVRITTHTRVLDRPLHVDDVMGRVASWLAQPHVHIPHPSDRHFDRVRGYLEHLGVAGNMTTDAHLAALAHDRGYLLVTTDADFARFPGLRWENPFAGGR